MAATSSGDLLMRIQTIATKYSAYIDYFYSKHSELLTDPYAIQYDFLKKHSFGVPETRSAALEKLGYETDIVYANVEPIQKRWATENEVSFHEKSWIKDIIRAQIQAFRPDILFFNTLSLSTEFVRSLRLESPSIRLVMGFCGSAFKDISVFEEYDVVITCIPQYVQDFRNRGIGSYYVNHSFDPCILELLNTDNLQHEDFVFIGSFLIVNGSHNKREKLILELIRETNLVVWSQIRQPSYRKRIRTALRQVSYDIYVNSLELGVPGVLLQKLPAINKASRWEVRPNLPGYIDRRLAERAYPPLFGIEMYQKLLESKVVLNTHGDIVHNIATNMRLYEATGVGTCLLTDWKANIVDLFEPDREVVTYRTADECIEKANYLLDHETERQEIAAAGQRRTLRDHTVAQRVAQIDEIIHSHLRVNRARR